MILEKVGINMAENIKPDFDIEYTDEIKLDKRYFCLFLIEKLGYKIKK